MSEKKPDPAAEAEMTRRAQQLAAALVKAANDPEADRQRGISEAEQERDTAALIAAYQASKKQAADGPGTPLANVAALRDYLRSRGHDPHPLASGLRLTDLPIAINWAAEHRQVRFTSEHALPIPADRRAEVAAAVATANAESAMPVWRTDPELIAEVVVATAADGSVSTSEVDRAIAILRTTLARHGRGLRVAAGG